MTEPLILSSFIAPPMAAELQRRMETAGSVAAEVYGTPAGGREDARVRSVRRLAVSAEDRDLVAGLLAGSQEAIGRHFAIPLSSFEEPQFLRYRSGDFFVAHQDGNTGMIRDDSMHRRVSAVVFVNSGYGGGDLVLHGRYPDYDRRYPVPAAPGTLVAFPAEATHEVLPVTHGERYTIVTWYR